MIHIFSDSTCDLSKELIEKYNITIIPLYIILNDKDYKDGQDISPSDIFKWSDEHKTTPKTSAASLDDVCRILRPTIEAGDEIIAFSISGEMSTMGNVIRLAADTLDAEDKIHYIDSRNLSTGIGHLVIEAAEMSKKGMSAKEIVNHINELIPKVKSSFVVDTLTYLHRGGRCGGVAALAGGLLKLHPKIIVKDGIMTPGKKYRGKYSDVILNYVKELKDELLQAKSDRVFVTHSSCDPEIVNMICSYLNDLGHFNEIIETKAGGVISSHCGPGTLGVLYIS